MKTIKGIVFDKDGTLLDFNKTWGSWIIEFLGEIFKKYPSLDKRLLPEVAYLLGYDLINKAFYPDSIVISETPEAGISKIISILPECTFSDLLALSDNISENTKGFEVFALNQIMSELKAMDISLAVATNDSEQVAVQHLKDCRIDSFFKFIIGYNSGYGSKPNPGMCLALCSKFKVSPSEVLMVGDSVHDMEAGKSAGMITVGVLTGFADKDTLSPLADVILPDISFLPEWITVNSIT